MTKHECPIGETPFLCFPVETILLPRPILVRNVLEMSVMKLAIPLVALGMAACSVVAQSVGPMVGQVSANQARFLYRSAGVVKNYRVTVLAPGGSAAGTSDSTTAAADDYTAKFLVAGLQPDTPYQYKLEEIPAAGAPVAVAGPGPDYAFRTFFPSGARGAVTVCFLSCANETSDPAWERMQTLGIEQLFLMGDTPYIDTTDLAASRQKHREFLARAPMAALIRHTPTVGSWDDHDFGLNNGNGLTVTGKAASRQAFVEYRAQDQFGTGTEGVYGKADHGIIEVFLLDPRWWSQTAPSPVDPTQKTCLGSAQWTWIRNALKASKAPFKVLAMGQVWEDKKNTETDDMFTYWYERDALFDFIRDEGIPGVVLIGGDIHLSRHLVHPQRVGYDLHDFVTSPLHTSTIASLDVYHPSLEWSIVEGRQFLTLTADTRSQPARLTARYIRHDGTVLHEVVVSYDQLVPRQGSGLGRELRACWSFEGDLANHSTLGSRLEATAANGASVVADGGLKGGAASFTRANSQYLVVPRSILHDNSAAHTVSLWCKPATLPAHGTTDRSFLLESTADGTLTGTGGYALSLGFRASATDASKINLELHTYTLQPAASTSAAPTAVAQGPFSTDLDRSVFLGNWTQVAFTFDSTRMKLFVNGAPVAEHVLPIPGPLCENGGLVIGGHRAGTGRNFDGLIDEVALWSRVLGADEIAALQGGGTPPDIATATTEADTDGDTLPDWWESMHGLDKANDDDALADTDGDGVPAYLEFEAGTSPLTDESALFAYLRELGSPGSTTRPMVFRHPSRNTTSFDLRYEESTGLTTWSPEDWGPVAPAPGGQELVHDLPASAAPARFIRLKAEP